MKKLLIISLVCLVTGCSTVQDKVESIFAAGYDTNEYALVNKIRTIAQTSKVCDEATVNNLYFTTKELNNFSQYLLRIVNELYDKEQPIGLVYCKAKLNILEKSAERIQQVTGSKSR